MSMAHVTTIDHVDSLGWAIAIARDHVDVQGCSKLALLLTDCRTWEIGPYTLPGHHIKADPDGGGVVR